MNATVMTTGPGVIIATATASRNWRSVSQWNWLTTPPCMNGTIARPLPKTNEPASAKYRPTWPSTARRRRHGATHSDRMPTARAHSAGAPAPQRGERPDDERDDAAGEEQPDDLRLGPRRRRRADGEEHPQQAIAPSVILTSLSALRAMIAMTDAPTP